ncbi:MAG: MgtC/SapB family protein [Nostocales cyanobacterium 94392]|nr:MgtC/SapB family protein [Nostocales cyanobacterium 94392]
MFSELTLAEISTFAPIEWQELSFRLAIALIIGIMIGLERETKKKAAGLRTNMLVSFASALLVLIPIQIGAAQQNLDVLGRVISGVISGVGFIGGGTILRQTEVKGLTSAATIWMSAALGIAVGCGLWALGLAGALITWIILRVFDRWEDYL